tara:strand:- start:509 stop:1213 length:705 start_codon:yes stop_codon:yes gene_type:complete
LKHLQSIHFGQTVQRYKLSDVLIEAINDKMDKDIENGSPVVAKYNYTSENSESSKIPRMDTVSTCSQEYRIVDWLEEIDINDEIKKCVTDTYNRSSVDKNFDLLNITVHDAWITDQVENEYQVVHKHSGYSQIGFAAVMYLKVPHFGEEGSETTVPHNGRLTMIGNGAGQFTNKTHLVTPEVGDLYIFPYDIEHCVYPFKGLGMRRSMSINFDVNMIKRNMIKTQNSNYYIKEI